ncbi:MAG: Hsp20/alpha crystallin family protein [Anaerolineae bacterium]|jgi:HSP20 family protein|nr:Hsp20/alpha crystallin family protein [Anaerolineae bacterium]
MLSNPFNFRSSFREAERLRRDMNELFEMLDRGPRLSVAATYPAMNVWTNPDGAIVTAELPGINPEDLEISVQGDTLTLRGNRSADALGEGEAYHRRERGNGQFQRAFQLPFAVDAAKVEATYELGVLSITLPRAESDKPRKIQVASA